MTVEQRQKMRNKISAQMSRIRKKGEAMYLNNIVKKKDDKFKKFVDVVTHLLDQKQLS